MDFGDAIRALKADKKVTRAGWNGKGMYLFLAKATALRSDALGPEPERGDPMTERPMGHFLDDVVPSVCMYTAQRTTVVGWLASQTDMLAEDWQEVTS